MKGMQTGQQNTVHRASSVDARAMAQEKLNGLLSAQRVDSLGFGGVMSFGFGESNATDHDTATMYGHTFEFTEYGDVTAGRTPVLIGDDNDATLEALATAINTCGVPAVKLYAYFVDADHNVLLLPSSGPGDSYLVGRALDADDFSESGVGTFTLLGAGDDAQEKSCQSTTKITLTSDDITDGITLVCPFIPYTVLAGFTRSDVVVYPTLVTIEISVNSPLVKIEFGAESTIQADDVLTLFVQGTDFSTIVDGEKH